MASNLIGRCACPECGFPSAHVKIKADKENAQPYRHCPDCGAQYFPRNKQQGEQLRAKIRAGSESTSTVPVKTPEPISAAPEKTPEPISAAPKKKGIFGQIAEALDD